MLTFSALGIVLYFNYATSNTLLLSSDLKAVAAGARSTFGSRTMLKFRTSTSMRGRSPASSHGRVPLHAACNVPNRVEIDTVTPATPDRSSGAGASHRGNARDVSLGTLIVNAQNVVTGSVMTLSATSSFQGCAVCGVTMVFPPVVL